MSMKNKTALPIEFIGSKPYSTGIVFAERYRVKIPVSFSWRGFWGMLLKS
jgi:hypothetical protein